MNILYWFSLPFVNAFNFSETIIIPMIVSMMGVSIYAMTNRVQIFRPSRLDFLIMVFMGSVIFSMLINVNSLQAKGVNHLMAIFSSYAILYYAPVMLSRKLSVERILAVLWGSYILCAVFGLFEFILANYTGVDLDAIIHRPSALDYKPSFLDILLIRSRSLFEESGYFANYMAILMPLMVHYLWRVKNSNFERITFILLSISASFVAFSVSMFIFLPGAIVIFGILRIVVERRITRTMSILFVVLLAIVLLVSLSDNLADMLFLRKFEGGSYQDRSEKYAATLDIMNNSDLLHLLFGYGPASYANLNILPATSVYFNFWRDYGIIGVSAYFLLVIHFLFISFSDKSAMGEAIFLSALVVQLFFIAIPTYYAPVTYLPMILYELRRRRTFSESVHSISVLRPLRVGS